MTRDRQPFETEGYIRMVECGPLREDDDEVPIECRGCTDCQTNGSHGEVCPKDPDEASAEGERQVSANLDLDDEDAE